MRRLPFMVIALALVLGAGLHAYRGIVGSLAMERGGAAEDDEAWVRATEQFRRAAVGAQRARALREAAERQLDHWEEQANLGGHLSADPALLDGAMRDYAECLCAAPAARHPWDGMSEIYEYLEWVEREGRAAVPPTAPDDPWEAIGRPGRISVGLARLAIERAPNWYALEDSLARRLWDFGARDAALEAVARAARTLPIYVRHRFRKDERHQPQVLAAFAAASWEVVGTTPLIHPVDHLIDLAKIELQRDEPARSVEALERALELGGDRTNQAEARLNLGLALLRLERVDEAATQFDLASEHPVFEQPALYNIATIAERSGDAERALAALRRLRRLDPRNVEYCLRFAQAARRLESWDAALESLRWAKLHHPADARVLRALGETQLDTGDAAAARLTLTELRRIAPEGPETERLARAISESRLRR